MTFAATLRNDIATALADPEAGWSLGAFGAAAEFRRRADEACEPLEDGRLGLRTSRGGIALVLPDAVRAVAYEMPIGDGWSHAVALCLPAEALDGGNSAPFAEIGPDRGAIDPARRDVTLFDLGLGHPQVTVCVRTRDASELDRLRAHLGAAAPDFEGTFLPAVTGGTTDLIFSNPLGRIEVLAGGLGDQPGPRAYVMAKILRLRRTHVATAPIPPGLVPCVHLCPAHPCRDPAWRAIPFDGARHAAFQALLARWGDPEAVAFKAAIVAGREPPHVPDRWSRAVERVVRVQAERIGALG